MQGTAWRSRVVGRARTIGNRVTVKSRSRVRIPPSPPKTKPPFRAVFALAELVRKDSKRAEVNDSPVDCQSREAAFPQKRNPSFSATSEQAENRSFRFFYKNRKLSTNRCSSFFKLRFSLPKQRFLL